MKKLILLMLAVFAVFLVSCGASEDAAPSPTESAAAAATAEVESEPVDGPEAFDGAGVTIIMAPDGAENVSYRIVGGSISEAAYTMDSVRYVFRGTEGKGNISGFILPENCDYAVCADAADYCVQFEVYSVGGGTLALWEDAPYAYALYAYEALDDDAMTNAVCDRARWAFIKNRFSAPDEMLEEAPEGFAAIGFTFVLPEGYDRTAYHIIDGDIAQTVFWKNDRNYVFRMAMGKRDISNIDTEFTETADSSEVDGEYFSGNIPIRYTPGDAGLAAWYAGGRSYSLYTDECDVNLMLQVAYDLASEAERQNPS
ncbi:MAG: hypothetical protein PHO15_09675 [Eubacteriales bacterium]|nr:hypothetical protein [Eubacteriales bacterium]